MELSTAIREGIRLAPRQTFGQLWSPDIVFWTHGDVLGLKQVEFGACALGAARLASGIGLSVGVDERVVEIFPVIDRWVPCPACAVGGLTATYMLGSAVVHLNDYHHWTRERIADWVELVELAIESRTVEIVGSTLVETIVVETR